MKNTILILSIVPFLLFLLLILIIIFWPRDDDPSKSPIGSECQKLSDCVESATNCVDNICIRSTFIGDPCGEGEPCMSGQTCDSVSMTCRFSDGEICKNNVDCLSDSSCILTKFCDKTSNSICGKRNNEGFPCPCQEGLCCDPETNICISGVKQITGFFKEFPSIPDGIKSFCRCHDKYVILHKNIYFGIKGNFELRYSVLKLKEIFFFHNLFALTTSDQIVEIDCDSEDETWRWKETNYPNKIRHYSVSHDGNYLWMQDDLIGYLYHKDELMKKIKTSSIRIMGRTCNTYLEMRDGYAIRYPIGDRIDDIKWGIMKEDGTFVKSNKKNFFDGDDILELI